MPAALRYWLLTCLSLSTLAGAEHHGQVTFGGLPVPGATVTATQGARTFVGVTDQQGSYSFPDLPDGTWTFRVEMLLFATVQRDVTIAPGAPGDEWELTLLPAEQLKAVANGPAALPLSPPKPGGQAVPPAKGNPPAQPPPAPLPPAQS